jgi:hypothetical protein
MTKADVFMIVANIYISQILRNKPIQLFVLSTFYIILFTIYMFVVK